jgi:hypothetical protein
MNSTAFLLLANSSLEANGNQKMELTIGSMSFCVGLSGTICLSDLTITTSGSSVGSSCEVNSPVSFATIEDTRGKIEELDETTEKLGIGETMGQSYHSQKDFVTQTGGVSGNIQ